MFSFIFVFCFLFFWFSPFIWITNIKLGVLYFIIGFFSSLFLAWIIVLILFLLCNCILRKLKPNHFLKRKVIASLSQCIRRFFFIKITIHNKHFIPLDGRLVIYTNHKTNFDAFLLCCFFPRTITFAPKDELYDGFLGYLLGFCFDAFDCLKIIRNNYKKTVLNIMKIIPKIKQNMAIVIYHEGGVKDITTDRITISLDGAFQIALKSNANILPITLKGIVAMRNKCWFRRKKVEIFVHPIIYFEEYKDIKTKQINQKVTNVINSVL